MATGRIPTTANSPLTAKGDLFTFSTGSAKLAVGNNGESLVADSSTSTGLRYAENYAAGKNKIINGDFNVNQRAFSSTTTTGTYGLDRWVMYTSGGTTTYSAQAFTPGAAPVAGYESKNFARMVTASQSAAGDLSILGQWVEYVRVLAGQTATISFWAKAASGTPKIAVEVEQTFGTGGSISSAVDTYAGQVTLSTSWARYSVTVAVPSISGKTLGTNANTTATAYYLWTSAGSTYNSRTGSLGVQNATIDIWGVQVEAGSTATAFQTATGTIQGELAACQRYYARLAGGSGAFFANAGYQSATQINGYLQYPVQMRVAPTFVQQTGTDYFRINRGGGNDTFNSLTIDGPSVSGTQFFNNTEMSGTIGYAGTVQTNNAAAYLDVNAEL